MRKHLTLLVAPPGTGKSIINLQIAIALAAGKPWGDWRPAKRARTMIVNTEDDYEEMCRRLYAAAEAMDVDQAELRGYLRLAAVPDESIVIVKRDQRTKEIVATDLTRRLLETHRQDPFDVLMVDPLSESHRLDENANSDIKETAMAWRRVAQQIDGAVLVSHHTPKNANGMAGDMNAARGGSALAGTARVIATMFNMTEDEAAALNVDDDERRRYLSVVR